MQLELGFGLSKFAGPLIFFVFVVVFFLTIFRKIEYGVFFSCRSFRCKTF